MKFTALDAMRGVAAIFVVIRHCPEFFKNNLYFTHSFLAVDIFFLLSGFVIAHAYGKKLTSGALSLKSFIAIRLIRLYPLYIFSTGLCFILALTHAYFSLHSSPTNYLNILLSFVLTSLFLPNLLIQMHQYSFLFPLNGVFWSLFYELAVNIQYAKLAKYFSSKNIAILLICCSMVLIYVAITEETIDAGITWGLGSIVTGYTRAAFGIFLGIYLYINHAKFDIKLFQYFPTVAPLAIVSIVMSAPNFHQNNWIFQLISIFLIFPMCILWASKSTEKNHSILLALGLMSYPLYVLHLPLKNLFRTLLEYFNLNQSVFTGFIFLIFAITMSLAIEKYYEIKARFKLKAYYFEKEN